jgi:hypothetical protein
MPNKSKQPKTNFFGQSLGNPWAKALGNLGQLGQQKKPPFGSFLGTFKPLILILILG